MTELRAAGRPRSGEATESILTAAADLLVEVGAEAFTIRELVVRSGTGSATVYRRWRTKEALLLAVAREAMGGAIPEPVHRSLAEDVEQVVRTLVQILTVGPVGAALPQLLRAAGTSAEMRREFEFWMASRRAVVERMLRIAVERGEARADLLVEHGADLLSGPVYYRFLVAGGTLDEQYVQVHVREFLRWAVGPTS